jgi:uncharacterized protein
VELTFEKPGDHLFIRAFSADGIQVLDELYRDSLILSANHLVDDWPVRSVDEFGDSDVERILALEPEVVILGTGEHQVFPEPRLMAAFYQRGAGIEVMTTAAACRTFNILVSEMRKVVAALIQPQAAPSP